MDFAIGQSKGGRIVQVGEQNANSSRLVLVSNRVPDRRKAAQAGGVAVALAAIARTRPTLWFGWNGEIKPPEETGTVVRDGRMATVSLAPAEHERFYLGYANSVLWPVFHNRLDLAQFEAGYFEQYVEVNRRFAALLQSMLQPDDVIWVHDYHLIPLAVQLRQLGVTNRIGFYLHIPFPPWQTFMAVPEHEQLARALAAYDLIGLQTKSDVYNLIDYMANAVSGSVVSDGRIRVFDRLVRVASFPIGINVADFAGAKPDASLVQGRGVSRIIGVDRLDYTKGLPQKFKAFGRFLEKYPDYRRQVVLTQIAPPSREDLEAYLDIRRQLETLSGSINGRFGELNWVPIHYIRRSTPHRRLIGIFRSSRIAMVTPLRDGMNLVAKEYVAAQDPEDPGVLILSRFAGAAEELRDALIVNPYSIDATADVIRVALEMSLDERRARHAALMTVVRKHDIHNWSQTFLAMLDRVRSPKGPVSGQQPESIRIALERLDESARRPKSKKAETADVASTSPEPGSTGWSGAGWSITKKS
jgi:trehalose 6-phosphate synthase